MCLFPINVKRVNSLLPCGKCIECLNTYSTEFAVRCMLEAKEHKNNCFVTLTYDDDNLPPELSKRDLQLFTKKLRFHLEKLGVNIRVFQCGEYGDKKGRPHYHMMIFGWCPDDLEFLRVTEKGEIIYKSAFISSIWGKGFISVGEISFRSAKYSSKYMQKIAFDGFPLAKPFILSSRRPGIGGLPSTLDYIKSKCLDTDKIYLNGRFYRIPNYYLKVLENDEEYAEKVARIRENRQRLVIPRPISVLSEKQRKFKLFLGKKYYEYSKKFGF